MALGDTSLTRFTSGFEKIRGTEYASREILPHHGLVFYWLPKISDWWQLGQFWFEKDVGLETVGAGMFLVHVDELYQAVTNSWQRVRESQPDAVWNPYNFKFVTVYKQIPVPGPPPPGSPQQPPPVPQAPDPKERRRMERDMKLAEVHRLYAEGLFSASIRDARIIAILADYPDLN